MNKIVSDATEKEELYLVTPSIEHEEAYTEFSKMS